jgi:hypothetical protein
MTQLKRQRSRFLIYPKFQLTLILVNTAILLLLILIVKVRTAQYFAALTNVGILSNLDASHPYFQELANQSETLNATLTSAFCFGAVLSIFLTIVLSHRLAGPIIRLRGYFLSIAEGGGFSENLKFRKFDFFSDLPPIVNKAVHRLQTHSPASAKSRVSRKKPADHKAVS